MDTQQDATDSKSNTKVSTTEVIHSSENNDLDNNTNKLKEECHQIAEVSQESEKPKEDSSVSSQDSIDLSKESKRTEESADKNDSYNDPPVTKIVNELQEEVCSLTETNRDLKKKITMFQQLFRNELKLLKVVNRIEERRLERKLSSGVA